MGTTPMDNNSLKVLTALRYLDRYRIISAILRHEYDFGRTSDISARVRSTWAMGCCNCPNRLSQNAIKRPCPIAAIAFQGFKKQGDFTLRKLTCFFDKLPGRTGMPMRCMPTPIAADVTTTTLWPPRISFTTASTIAAVMESNGWYVSSSMIEVVPGEKTVKHNAVKGR